MIHYPLPRLDSPIRTRISELPLDGLSILVEELPERVDEPIRQFGVPSGQLGDPLLEMDQSIVGFGEEPELEPESDPIGIPLSVLVEDHPAVGADRVPRLVIVDEEGAIFPTAPTGESVAVLDPRAELLLLLPADPLPLPDGPRPPLAPLFSQFSLSW